MIKDLINIANILDKRGLTKEADILDIFIKKVASKEYEGYRDNLEVFENPGLNKMDVIKAYEQSHKEFFGSNDGLFVLDAEWNSLPTTHPHYIITYIDKTISERVAYNEFALNNYRNSGYDIEVEGKDGKIYYLYAEF